MKILRLSIEGFRGIEKGQIDFDDHTVLIGPNGCGKSTVVDALALIFGRERIVRTLTEHDFSGSDALGLNGDSETVVATSQLQFARDVRGASALKESLERKCRLTGQLNFSLGALRAESSRILQRMRSHSSRGARGTAAMTIHQAKNREFENVIVLWPLELAGTPESLRRLLYNGVTRAKSRVLVIVHSPPDKKGQVKDRLISPPFSK